MHISQQSYFRMLVPRSRRHLFLWLLVLLAIAAWLRGGTPTPGEGAVLPVVTAKVEREGSYRTMESFVGRVEARRRSDLGFERPGRVVQVLVEEGARVKAGDILAHFNIASLQARRAAILAQLDRTRAEGKEAGARLELAQTTVDRRQTLMQGGNISAQRYDEALSDAKAMTSRQQASSARMREVQAELAALDVEINESTIRAPYAGSIVARHVDEGSTVSAGQRVLRLVEDGEQEIKVGVPPQLAAEMKPGQEYDAVISGRTVKVVLAAVLAEVDPATHTVGTIFRLPAGSEPRPPVGEVARIQITRDIPIAGAWLPVTALAEGRRGLWTAYAVEPVDGPDRLYRIARRDLKVIYSDGERTFVDGAITDGETVVSTGLHRLVPGQIVRLQ